MPIGLLYALYVRLSQEEVSFLNSQHSAAMITIGESGLPKPVRVGIALVDGKLWSSGSQSRIRTRRLRRDPRCTAPFLPGSSA